MWCEMDDSSVSWLWLCSSNSHKFIDSFWLRCLSSSRKKVAVAPLQLLNLKENENNFKIVQNCLRFFPEIHGGVRKANKKRKVVTASKKRDQWITKLYWKSNGKIEIFGEKMYGKEVLLDKVFPLVRLTGQLANVSRTKAFPTPVPMFASWVVKPHHVNPHFKPLSQKFQ